MNLANGIEANSGANAPEDESGTREILTFRLAHETFGIRVIHVREVLDYKPISRIANSPSTLLGVIDVRGAGVPVVDIKAKLRMPHGDGEPTADSRIVVLDFDANGRRLTLAVIADGEERAAVARRAVVAADTEVGDLQRATNKLDAEVEQVRARSRRDSDRLASGSASPKELEGLQHEIESLRRRQGTLEDAELELMEQREAAEGVLATARAALAGIESGIAEAVVTRDAAFAEVDAVVEVERAKRARLVTAIPEDVLALYTRIKDQGKVAAGELLGGRCGACRIEIDRIALGQLRAAPIDAVVRCPECGAILVRA